MQPWLHCVKSPASAGLFRFRFFVSNCTVVYTVCSGRSQDIQVRRDKLTACAAPGPR